MKSHPTESSPFLITAEPLVSPVNETTVETENVQEPTNTPSVGTTSALHSVVTPTKERKKSSWFFSRLRIPEKPVPLRPYVSPFPNATNLNPSAHPEQMFTDIISLMQSYNVSFCFFIEL